MNLGELFIEIGVIGDSKKLDEFNKKVKETVFGSEDAAKKAEAFGKALKIIGKRAALVVGALTAAYWAMDRLTASLAKQNLAMLNLTRTSSVALETYQKWATIGKIAGVSGIEQQIRSLDQRIFNLRLTGEGARGFQLAGILPTNAEDVLNQLRNRVSGMNNTAASYLLEQMGLSPEMITLLKMGRDEWEQYLKVQEKFTLNKDQRKELDKMNRQLEVARLKMQYLKDSVLLALLPLFLKISQAIAAIAGGIAQAINWVTKAKTPLAQLTRALLTTLGTFIALKAVMLSWKVLMLALPFLINGVKLALVALKRQMDITTLGITLLLEWLFLIAEDIWGYFNGKDSLIGTIINGIKDLDLKGFIDFPVPKWLEYLIELIHWKDKNRAKGAAYDLLGIFGPVGSVLSWKLQHDQAIKDLGNNYDSVMTPAGKTVTYTTTNNQSIPVNQTNYIYTNEAASTVNNNLRYTQGMVIAPQ